MGASERVFATADDSLTQRVRAAVASHYEVERELGRGGMAVVYQATDRKLRRKVALKVLPPELAFREDVRSRFLREAQTAAKLNHPHIVPIYAVDEQDGLVYFAMGLVEGEPLAAVLAREPRLPLETVRRTLTQVADALAYAHALGVVHRDVKPDNILLDRITGRAMVTDFGIARAAEGDQRLTVTGVAVGTPTYMSPEQATGDKDVDGRSDIYSLGVVGYQMLAGTPPFSAANTPAMLMKHVTETPPSLVGVRPDAPRDLLQVIEVALRKGRAERWATAALFRDALAGGELAAAAFATVAVAAPPRGRNLSVGGMLRDVGEMAAVSARAAIDAVQEEQRKAQARAIGVDVPPLPEGFRAPPVRPEWREGMRKQDYRLLVDEWKAQAERWHHEQEMMRETYAERARLVRHGQRALRAEWKDAVRNGLVDPNTALGALPAPLPLEIRVKGFRRRVMSGLAFVFMLGIINAITSPQFPWFIFPAMAMGMEVLNRFWRLRDLGVRFTDAIRGIVTPGARDVHGEAGALAAPGAGTALSAGAAPVTANAIDREIATFAPGIAGSRDPFLREGKVYATVRAAAADRIAIRDTIARLSDADRQMIPDATPTVDGLCDRVGSLAQHIARIDHDLSGNVRLELEEKLSALAHEAATPEVERRRALLERQRNSLDDLASRREGFVRQLESASIALRNLRFDLAKLRTSGVGAAINDVTSATQEARALSVDIARAMEVADEVRKI
ncbi:MAG: protein kinase [Gemmatimonadaceae bacterium]|jgi:serine/threonine-protein kinase|nr:protein kinase [Gemmatimonadaceae bacterium]